MTFSPSKKMAVLLASAALMIGSAAPALAQSSGGGSANGASADTAAPMAPASSATTKAQRKAARKQARAKKNAELKKLEANGYNPSRNDPNYPTDLQNAEKKAGAGQAASQ